MKTVLRYVGITFGLLFCFLMFSKPVKAEAATTYKVTWDYNTSLWCVSTDGGKSWTQGIDLTKFADGDVLIVDGDNRNSDLVRIEVNAKIGELAVVGKATASVKCNDAALAYAVTGGSVLILDGNADEINANYGATVQVLGNVGKINCTYNHGTPIKIGVSGTVGEANVNLDNPWNEKRVYNVAAGKFTIDDDDVFRVSSEYYSLTPVAQQAAPAASTPSQDQGRQLDKVPKTGRSPLVPVSLFALSSLFALAAVVAGSRKEKKNA